MIRSPGQEEEHFDYSSTQPLATDCSQSVRRERGMEETERRRVIDGGRRKPLVILIRIASS